MRPCLRVCLYICRPHKHVYCGHDTTGFAGTKLRGSEHNDSFYAAHRPAESRAADSREVISAPNGTVVLRTASNHAGGVIGGISNGEEVVFKVAIKPVSTIGQPQTTATFSGQQVVLEARGRHDACVLPRAPPLVEGMAAIVVMDAVLQQRARSGPVSSLATLSAATPKSSSHGVQRSPARGASARFMAGSHSVSPPQVQLGASSGFGSMSRPMQFTSSGRSRGKDVISVKGKRKARGGSEDRSSDSMPHPAVIRSGSVSSLSSGDEQPTLGRGGDLTGGSPRQSTRTSKKQRS